MEGLHCHQRNMWVHHHRTTQKIFSAIAENMQYKYTYIQSFKYTHSIFFLFYLIDRCTTVGCTFHTSGVLSSAACTTHQYIQYNIKYLENFHKRISRCGKYYTYPCSLQRVTKIQVWRHKKISTLWNLSCSLKCKQQNTITLWDKHV